MVNYVSEEEHINIIKNLIAFLFDSPVGSDLVLKGGTALLLYHGLDRFSEDIDLDASKVNIENLLRIYCNNNKYKIRITKSTNTVKRYMIDYNDEASLKVEVSYRNTTDRRYVDTFGKVRVYSLEKLFLNKINAFMSPNRNKIRDLYDIAYIYYQTDVNITPELEDKLYDMFAYDNMDHVERVIANHKDEIIPEKNIEGIREAMYSIFYELYPDN